MTIRRPLWCWFLPLLLVLVVVLVDTATAYTADDDVSWAIRTTQLEYAHHQSVYDEFIASCNSVAIERGPDYCTREEAFRLQMNMYQPQSVYNYTKMGFQKVRAPPELMQLLRDFWNTNQHQAVTEWKTPTPYHNTWEAPTTILRLDNRTLPGGGPPLQAAIANAARNAMEAWTGVAQSMTSVYGIRVYHNQSILTPHVDRLPLVSSCILNIAQDVEEDWFLEVYDHDGVAHNVTMEPGDMVLYESHSVIHGRPFKLKGNFYANAFVHFNPLGPPVSRQDSFDFNSTFPPFLIANSSWEPEWREKFPNGWTLLSDPVQLASKADIQTLRYLAKVNPEKLHETDGTPAEWKAIHEAARQGYVDILKFLIEEQGFNVNEPCKVTGGSTPLALARKFLPSDHAAVQYLESMGGKVKETDEIDRIQEEL